MEITVDHRWLELITIQYKKAHCKTFKLNKRCIGCPISFGIIQ